MKDNPYKKLGGQTLIYGLGTIVPRILNYVILTVYYTRRLEVQEFGIITELYAYISVFMVLMTYGLETGYFRFSIDTDGNRLFSTTSFSLLISSAGFIIIGYIFSGRIANLLDYGNHPEYLRWAFIIVGLDAVTSLFIAKLRIEERIYKFVVVQILNVLITIVFVIFFLELLPGLLQSSNSMTKILGSYRTKVYYIFLANFLASFVRLIILFTEYRKIKFSFDRKLLQKILIYSLPLLAVQLSGIINESIDRILLRQFLPKNMDSLYELGIYGANFRIAMLMTLFIQMFRYAADPFYFTNYKSDNAKTIYADVMRYFVLFCMVIFLMVMLYIDIFKLLVDQKFHSGIRIVPIVLYAAVLNGLVFNLSIWYKLSSKTYYGIVIIGSGALLTILLNAVLIPSLGYYGCAITRLASNAVMVILSYVIGQRFFKIDYEVKKILLYMVLTGFIYAFSELTKIENMYYNMIKNTLLFLPFIYYIGKREKLIKIFIRNTNDH